MTHHHHYLSQQVGPDEENLRWVTRRNVWETMHGLTPAPETQYGFRWVYVGDTPGADEYVEGSSVGKYIFNNIFQNSGLGGHTVIVWRECYQGCAESHRNIYYRRISNPSNWDAWDNFMRYWKSSNNVINTNFELYGSEADLAAQQNRWTYCNYDDTSTCGGVAFPRNCGPTGSASNQWISRLNLKCQSRRARWYIAVKYGDDSENSAVFKGNHDQSTLR